MILNMDCEHVETRKGCESEKKCYNCNVTIKPTRRRKGKKSPSTDWRGSKDE